MKSPRKLHTMQSVREMVEAGPCDVQNPGREYARAASQRAVEELEPWVRAQAPEKGLCNVARVAAAWIGRPFLRMVPLRLRLRLMKPFWAHFVEIGGELRANLLVVRHGGFEPRRAVTKRLVHSLPLACLSHNASPPRTHVRHRPWQASTSTETV